MRAKRRRAQQTKIVAALDNGHVRGVVFEPVSA